MFRNLGIRTPVIALSLLLCCTLSPIGVGAQPGLDVIVQPTEDPDDTLDDFVQPTEEPGVPNDKTAPDFNNTDQGDDPAPADSNQADSAGNAGSAESENSVITGVPSTGFGTSSQSSAPSSLALGFLGLALLAAVGAVTLGSRSASRH